jgi:hypothetical protein
MEGTGRNVTQEKHILIAIGYHPIKKSYGHKNGNINASR